MATATRRQCLRHRWWRWWCWRNVCDVILCNCCYLHGDGCCAAVSISFIICRTICHRIGSFASITKNTNNSLQYGEQSTRIYLTHPQWNWNTRRFARKKSRYYFMSILFKMCSKKKKRERNNWRKEKAMDIIEHYMTRSFFFVFLISFHVFLSSLEIWRVRSGHERALHNSNFFCSAAQWVRVSLSYYQSDGPSVVAWRVSIYPIVCERVVSVRGTCIFHFDTTFFF